MSLGYIHARQSIPTPVATGAGWAPDRARDGTRAQSRAAVSERAQSDTRPPPATSCACGSVLVFLVVQFVFSTFALVWCGAVLKWKLTFGDHTHAHPHVPHEDYIQRPNNYLSVMMAAFIVDAFESIWLIVLSACAHRCSRSARWTCVRRTTRFISACAMLIVGTAVGALVAVGFTQYPMLLPPPPPAYFASIHPPNAPPPPSPYSPLYSDADVAVMYAATGVVVVWKYASYLLQIPQRLVQM